MQLPQLKVRPLAVYQHADASCFRQNCREQPPTFDVLQVAPLVLGVGLVGVGLVGLGVVDVGVLAGRETPTEVAMEFEMAPPAFLINELKLKLPALTVDGTVIGMRIRPLAAKLPADRRKYSLAPRTCNRHSL